MSWERERRDRTQANRIADECPPISATVGPRGSKVFKNSLTAFHLQSGAHYEAFCFKTCLCCRDLSYMLLYVFFYGHVILIPFYNLHSSQHVENLPTYS